MIFPTMLLRYYFASHKLHRHVMVQPSQVLGKMMGRAKVGLNDIQSPQVLQLPRIQINTWIKKQTLILTDV